MRSQYNTHDEEGFCCPECTCSEQIRRQLIYGVVVAFVISLVITLQIIIASSQDAWLRVDEAKLWLAKIEKQQQATQALVDKQLAIRDSIRTPVRSLKPQGRPMMTVVVPFVRKQMKQMLQFLDRWALPQYAPLNDTLVTSMRHPIDLIFYFNRQRDFAIEEQINTNLKKNNIAKYFSAIKFMYAGLSDAEDLYPYGPTNMFYKLMDNPIVRENYYYFFYMEPDCLPIRPGWLDIIQELTFTRSTPFWIQGGIYYGSVTLQEKDRFHINGNAIYSTADDYHELLRAVMKHVLLAYDIDIMNFLLTDIQLLRRVWHQFVYSDFIANMFRSSYSEKKMRDEMPNLYFIHGGTNIDEN
jgi:hypothetical protein